MKATIQTALGAIPTDQLGPTSSHEHLFLNMMRERRGDGLLVDEALMCNELEVFASQGGGTIFDLTTAELTVGSAAESSANFTAATSGQTRSPENVAAIQRVSERTGVNVVLGAGRYRDPYLDRAFVDRSSVADLAHEIVRDLEEGIPGTTARAGLIGEIGADKWYVSATEERSFRAAARAHLRTGAPIYTHAARWKVALAQIELLTEEGVNPGSIAIGHVDTVPDAGFCLELARRGVYVGIDTINSSTPHEVSFRVAQVVALHRAGYGDRVLLGHDVCLVSQLRAFGGNGFGFLLDGFRAALRQHGVTDGEYQLMVEDNPARFIVGRN